ncbi:39S ribosomal protein L10, mitochondrial [Zeugodacus cucurbitae]|uniref:Large ribosomal subunit protein uL10m n=1 Tax=Zeugodacus cucurbitae TaxID=28588 RepID=A0A0A1XLA7_ZEUCU|nr:39S ribosomal protein L10, mitochondrial [Zeugodacus cucurbitae]XP_028898637.1 39S ribosomal protein L10, mitochondrial [Zeugodacus cucurbitae]XP_054083463.1 39S ribosomal protein L10, mitochondrial [Zeugodacus cucurbitae]
MSQLLRQVTLLSCRAPIQQSQRFRGKINIQRPRAPHYERAKVLAAAQYLPAEVEEPKKKSACFQRRQRDADIENPYIAVIAREVSNWLEHSHMVGFYHLNSIKDDELFSVRVQLHKQNMHLKSYGKKIVQKAVEGTRFEAILPLFESNNCVVFSTQQQVPQLLRITRRVPQMLLLAGIVDERLLSRNEFMEYAKLPGLQAAQGQLVQTLNMAAGNVVQQLETHQKNFVNVLDVYAKGETNESVPAKEANEEEKA